MLAVPPFRDAGLYARDPVSELFDSAARRLLARAYGQRGRWTATRLAQPGPRHLAWAASQGINLLGPDPADTLSGGHQNARSAWARGFVRAVYYQHKWYYRANLGGLGELRRLVPNDALAVRFRVGRLMPVRGVIPAGREVAILVLPGGLAARRAVAAMPAAERIYLPDGRHGGRAAAYE